MTGRRDAHSLEISEGRRFEFGKNWKRFLSVLDDERISEAEMSLKQMLEVDDLAGSSFLDIGSGSGLFSLAARRLGAKVRSIDYDPESVACTGALKKRYFPDDNNWVVERGSVLDKNYVMSLGKFDIVYSWGVLHHTGAMWRAIENVQIPVKGKGTLFIGIYNDEGFMSIVWEKVKKIYCSGLAGKVVTVGIYFPYCCLKYCIAGLLRLRNPVGRYIAYKKHRGMSAFHDWLDWLGGYPYEFASAGEIFDYFRQNGYVLTKLKTGGGHAINEFVFIKEN